MNIDPKKTSQVKPSPSPTTVVRHGDRRPVIRVAPKTPEVNTANFRQVGRPSVQVPVGNQWWGRLPVSAPLPASTVFPGQLTTGGTQALLTNQGRYSHPPIVKSPDARKPEVCRALSFSNARSNEKTGSANRMRSPIAQKRQWVWI